MKFEKNLSYRGRIISLAFVALMILAIREVVKSQFGEVPHFLPIPALIPLIIAWFLGKHYDQTMYLSTRDSLTGLYNRRYVLNNFAKYNADKIKDFNIAVLLFDVNDFKEINDNYGHEFGDRVLEGLSSILEQSFSKKDIIARWGGDEFLVLTKFNDENDLQGKIELFENNLKAMEIKNNVSVSIGKAIFPTDGKQLNDLLLIADQNMYAVKTNHKLENEEVGHWGQ
ncbi:hypothetical protein UACE39S_00676 [Ureibacillus acetophenoni]